MREEENILLKFSEGADATVVLRMAESGKIGFLGLQSQRDPSEMTDEERVTAARQAHFQAIESLGTRVNDVDLQAFMEAHMASSYLATVDENTMLEALRQLKKAIDAAGGVVAGVDDAGLATLSFEGPQNVDVLFTIEDGPPYRMATFSVNFLAEPRTHGIEIGPIDWENIAERLTEEEQAGFAGTVLVVREGKTMLHKGYGYADAAAARPNTTETIFDIGSTPIDFTRAAVLKLQDDGRLALSNTIDQFFDHVPEDKQSITLHHLMTSRSGLGNFHHLPEDQDHDLSWIDRDEALRRIFEKPLLFVPGEGESHSHSAYSVLAAVVEVVTGQTYASYLQKTFFDPIGMDRTGFYGDQVRFSDEAMATGYGPSRAGERNNPRYWGPTSWLVMGSGGMVSNPSDMYRWLQAMYAGNYLSEDAMAVYRHGGVVSGGTDRGFLLIYLDNPSSTVILSSNVLDADNRQQAVARALVEMVRKDR